MRKAPQHPNFGSVIGGSETIRWAKVWGENEGKPKSLLNYTLLPILPRPPPTCTHFRSQPALPPDSVNASMLFDFYNGVVPQTVATPYEFEKWYADEAPSESILFLPDSILSAQGSRNVH